MLAQTLPFNTTIVAAQYHYNPLLIIASIRYSASPL